MKTRIIATDIWDADEVYILNIDTKLLYLILLTNPYIGQGRIYKINDRQLSTFSGLNVDQIQKCKSDLEIAKMAFFNKGYVCITGYGFIESFYKGSRNEVAKQKEFSSIPFSIMSYFTRKLDTLSIPYTYPIDTTINHNTNINTNINTNVNAKKEKQRLTNGKPNGNPRLPLDTKDIQNVYNSDTQDRLELILNFYNTIFNKQMKSVKGFSKNAEYWLEDYSLTDIALAFINSSLDSYWLPKMTPEMMFRRKAGQDDTDRIGKFSKMGKPIAHPEWEIMRDKVNQILTSYDPNYDTL